MRYNDYIVKYEKQAMKAYVSNYIHDNIKCIFHEYLKTKVDLCIINT